MKIREIEKAIYTNEKFLEKLEILKEENWEKATSKERIEFFAQLHKIITSVDNSYGEKVMSAKIIEKDKDQTFFIVDEGIVLNREFFKKAINPYSLISNYFFELEFDSNLRLSLIPNAKRSEKGRMMAINNSRSVFKDWFNFYERDSDNFYYQPLSHKSIEVADKLIFNFTKYMHKKYGMDKYLTEYVSRLMLASFEDEDREKEVEKNFKKMEENYAKYDTETEQIHVIEDFLANFESFSQLETNDFLALFNSKLIFNYDDGFRLGMYREFGRRILKGYDGVEETVNEINLGSNEEYGYFILVGNKQSFVDEEEEFAIVLDYLIDKKIENNILDEISDSKLREEACKCYKYLKEFDEEDEFLESKYLVQASPYAEVKKYLNTYYHSLMKKAICNNSFFNDGKPLVKEKRFAKYDAFFMFAFEDKDKQFELLEKEYNTRKGGKR